ncbi:LEA type 2 family protein [Lysobacter sp.]|uniref:NDR1/HIN1-like protein n=1 Tax=Lysobacter sp. TaxID=72226 RepID=UPI002D351520|nr:LEA type 2 family protein [Lysobacter sp.]HZX76278.1 LEA type 2 family protein [Lysobacter sp.]
MHWRRWTGLALTALLLAGCSSGPVRRVSEPSARIQQLTVRADGSWSAELRIENFSSVPMRFDTLDLAVEVAQNVAAGNLRAQPALTIGPESADVITVTMSPQVAAKIAVADALASGRSVPYSLRGRIDATPDEAKQRSFDVSRNSELSPAPGLPGVLR